MSIKFQSDIVYTFFHSILRDQKEDFIYLHEKTPYDALDESSQSSKDFYSF